MTNPDVHRSADEVRLAASFLTIIPVGADSAIISQVAGSFGWFPLIGFALGACLAVTDYLVAFIIPRTVRSVLLVIALAIVTGALHLDGLADTADALAAGRDRARALEILRDTRIGTFGTVAVFLVMALKIVALASAADYRRCAIYLAPGIARWAMVAVPYRLDYLRKQGAGSTLLADKQERNLRIASIITLIGLLPAGAVALRAIITGAIITWILRAFYARWLGGVTGDLIGAAGEIVEAAVLVAVTS